MTRKNNENLDPKNIPLDNEKTEAKREGWNADKLGDESANQDDTEIARQVRRGMNQQAMPMSAI